MSNPAAVPGTPQPNPSHPKAAGVPAPGAGSPPPHPSAAPIAQAPKAPMRPPAGQAPQQARGATGVTRRPGSGIAAALTGGAKPPAGATGAGQRPPLGVTKPPAAHPATAGGRPAAAATGRQPVTGQARPPAATGQARPPATGQVRPPATGQARPPATGQVRPAAAGQARPPVAGQARKPGAQGRPAKQSNRRAHLRVTKLDLLSILKMAFLFAFCVGVVVFVALYMLWNVLVASGAIGSAQSLLNSVMANPNSAGPVDLGQFLSTQRVMGFITASSVLSIFVLTLLGTVFGMLYNLASSMFGGLEVTLEV